MSEVFRIDRDPALERRVAARFAEVAAALREILGDPWVEHVGSAAVPGSLTKGDVDVQVVVSREAFDAAAAALGARYVHEPGGFPPPDGMSFKDGEDVGIHLTVHRSEADIQRVLTAWLREDPELRARYDALKRAWDGRDMDEYREEKSVFFEALLAMPRFAALRDRLDAERVTNPATR